MTLWSLLDDADDAERDTLLGDIAAEYPNLDLELVNPDAAETLVYAELVALSVLKRFDERDVVAQRDAVKYIKRPGVATRVRLLLGQPNPDLSQVL
jgi:hypothetical protein